MADARLPSGSMNVDFVEIFVQYGPVNVERLGEDKVLDVGPWAC